MYSRIEQDQSIKSNEFDKRSELYLGSMVSPHIDHVMAVEAQKEQQNVEDRDVKSECGLSLRGMHALCPAKDDKEMQMNSISLEDPYKAIENENGYFNMLIAENKLCWDMLGKKFQDIEKEQLAP
jgi:hypothetical protein